MASINEKLNYINETKSLIKDKLNDLGSEIEDETTFREYAEKIEDLYNEWPKINDEDTTITLNNTKKGKMNLQLKGNINQFTTIGSNLCNIQQLQLLVNSSGKVVSNSTFWDAIIDTRNINSIYISGNYSLLGDNALRIGGFNEYPILDMQGTRITYSGNSALNTTNYNYVLLCFTPSTNHTIEEIKNSFMVNIGTTPLSYEPYTGGIASPNPDYPQDIEVVTGENTITISNEDNTESQTFNINLGNLELCRMKNTDVQDFISKEDNKWYKNAKLGKYIFNGSEAWGYSDPDYTFSKSNISNLNLAYNSLNVYCTHFKVKTNSTSIGYFRIGNKFFNFNFDDGANGIDNYKTWLTTHNVTVVYPLIDLEKTEITDTALITQLNALEQAMSYDTQTNISQTNNNLPFIITASALLKNSN